MNPTAAFNSVQPSYNYEGALSPCRRWIDSSVHITYQDQKYANLCNAGLELSFYGILTAKLISPRDGLPMVVMGVMLLNLWAVNVSNYWSQAKTHVAKALELRKNVESEGFSYAFTNRLRGSLLHPEEVDRLHTVWANDFYHKVHLFLSQTEKLPSSVYEEFFEQNPLDPCRVDYLIDGDRSLLNETFVAVQKEFIALKDARKTLPLQEQYARILKLSANFIAFVKTLYLPAPLKVNELAKGFFVFPSMAAVKAMPINEIHAIWARNLVMLMGLAVTKNIPRFGFHGTSSAGMTGVLISQQNKESFYVAGYEFQLDPVAYVADLLTMVRKSSGYSSNSGGVFIVDTTKGTHSISKYIWNNEFFRVQAIQEDIPSHKVFLRFVDRCNSEEGNRDTHFEWTDEEISTHICYPAVEQLTHFTSLNFEERIKGVVPSEHSLYPLDEIDNLEKQNEISKTNLARRLKCQELVVLAFHHLGVLHRDLDLTYIESLGQELMRNPESVAKITGRRVHELRSETFHSEYGF